MYKLGIDVGGTNTDAVLVDENRAVVADIKYPTSADIYDGILGAMRTVLEVSGVDPAQIHQAMLGTTQCTNAIVERKNLAPIGILRIGAPATTGIRPMVDWSEDIQKVAVGSTIIGGGFEYDGKELAPLDTAAAKAFFEEMKAKGVKSIAISCVFSTVRNDHELRAAELWFDETEQKWNGWELCVESAFQTPYFGGEYSEDVAEHLQEIVLGNSDHAAADMCVLYDSEENVIRDTNTIYHKQ